MTHSINLLILDLNSKYFKLFKQWRRENPLLSVNLHHSFSKDKYPDNERQQDEQRHERVSTPTLVAAIPGEHIDRQPK